MKYRRFALIGLLGGGVALWAIEATAHTAGMRTLADGTRIHASSVRWEFQGTTGSSSPDGSTGVCNIAEVNEAILFCLNPTNKKITGEAAIQEVTFGDSVGLGQNLKKGKTKYIGTARANGLATSDAECDLDPDCMALRERCVNPNWVPYNLVPISMMVTLEQFACTDSEECPCSATGENGLPLCFDHDTTDLDIDPEGRLTYACTLPNPDTYELGELRQYDCSLVP